MGKKNMSISTANKVVDIYADCLGSLQYLPPPRKLGYSSLQGYDIYDLDHALKLCTAYRVFQHERGDTDNISKIKKFADEDDSALLSFFFHFYPDEIVEKLRERDENDNNSLIEAFRIETNSQEPLKSDFQKSETVASFLNFCLSQKSEKGNYWEEIYSRIGIEDENANETNSNAGKIESTPFPKYLGWTIFIYFLMFFPIDHETSHFWLKRLTFVVLIPGAVWLLLHLIWEKTRLDPRINSALNKALSIIISFFLLKETYIVWNDDVEVAVMFVVTTLGVIYFTFFNKGEKKNDLYMIVN